MDIIFTNDIGGVCRHMNLRRYTPSCAQRCNGLINSLRKDFAVTEFHKRIKRSPSLAANPIMHCPLINLDKQLERELEAM